MAAVWNPSPTSAGKQSKSTEKMDRELRRLRFDVKQYDAQLKKLQRDLVSKNSELKKLKSCGACTCLGDRRRNQQNQNPPQQQQQRSSSQMAEVRDLGTFGNVDRGMADNARLEIHGQRPRSVEGRRTENVADRGRRTPAAAATGLRRSRTDFFHDKANDGGGNSSNILAEKDRELGRLHQELAQLRLENSALKEESSNGNQQRQRNGDENIKTLRELGRQVHELESELFNLREERRRLLAESEHLRGDIDSKETNLLRCEKQLTKAEREKTELLAQVRRLENRERQLSEELNEYQRRSSSRNPDAHGNGTTPSRMHRWSSDLALSRAALTNGNGGGGGEIDHDSRRTTGEHSSNRRNEATSVNGYHHHQGGGTTATTAVVESSARTRDCNPYCEVCRIYRSKLVKHTDRKLGQMNGAASTSNLTAAQAQAELEVCKNQLETLRTKQKVFDTAAIDSGFSDIDRPEKPYHDRATMQRELDQYIEQQEKQKRLLQKYSSEIHSYERTVGDKDREIAKLKAKIRELERNYGCIQKHLAERESSLVQLQRDLTTINTIKEKTEMARIGLGDDYKRLEQQYQKVLQDKAGLQQELTLCVDEQDKQKRLAQRYLMESQNYERLVSDKDREISELKTTIRDLTRDYEVFRKSLSEQEANLLRLQRNLTTANTMKEKTELSRVVLADDYKRLQQQYQKMFQDKAALQREFELCAEEADKQKRLLHRYLNEIQAHEQLLAEKERERMDMLLQFQASAERVCKCGNSPPRN